MTTGVVTSVTPRRAGGALSASVTSTDTVLPLDDAGDFDEEFDEARFLVIGEETTPREYVAVENDEDAQQSVTLAVAVGAAFEDGLPVTLWDPASDAADKRAVDYQAWVRLDDQEKPIPATIPHTMIPTAGAFSLVGASVRIDDGGGEWYVSDVLGREATVSDVDIIGAQFLTAPDGRRVVITSSLPGFEGGAFLVYTGHPDEADDKPGYVTSSVTDLGTTVVLQTVVAGPQIAGAPSRPTLGLSAQTSSGTFKTFAVVNADHLQFNGEKIILDAANVAFEIGPSPAGFAGPFHARQDGATGLAFGTARLSCINSAGGYVQIRASSFDVSSDADRKADVTRVVGALAAVEAIEPADFTRTDTGEDGRGFMAQEVQAVLPIAATGSTEGDETLGVDLYPLVGTLWAALREETAARKALEKRVAALEGLLGRSAEHAGDGDDRGHPQ